MFHFFYHASNKWFISLKLSQYSKKNPWIVHHGTKERTKSWHRLWSKKRRPRNLLYIPVQFVTTSPEARSGRYCPCEVEIRWTRSWKQQAIIGKTRKLNLAKAERQNSELEADLKLLSKQSEAAAGAAEVEALEYEDIQNSVLDIPLSDKNKLVEQYVENAKEECHSNIQDRNEIPFVCSENHSRQFAPLSTLAPTVPNPCVDLDNVSQDSSPLKIPLNPQAQTCFAKACTSTPVLTNNNNNVMANELTHFLMKKDLLLSWFSVFNDQPESFPVWKSSFVNIYQDMGVNPREE